MAPSLQRGGRVLAAEIKKPLVRSQRQKHQLVPQASRRKKTIQGGQRNP
jgi:hypothetical protein